MSNEHGTGYRSSGLYGPSDGQLLTTQEAADFMRVSVSSLYVMRHNAELPHVMMGRKVMYRKEALLKWIDSKEQIKYTSDGD